MKLGYCLSGQRAEASTGRFNRLQSRIEKRICERVPDVELNGATQTSDNDQVIASADAIGSCSQSSEVLSSGCQSEVLVTDIVKLETALDDAKEEVTSAIKKAKKLEERMWVSDRALLMNDVHVLKFHTGNRGINSGFYLFCDAFPPFQVFQNGVYSRHYTN